MGKSEGVDVTIINWSAFNGRKDVSHPSWFRLEYRMIEDPDFYDFTHEEFKVWIYILSQACRKNSGSIRINFTHAEATARISGKGFIGAITKLKDLGIIEANVTCTSRGRHADVTDTFATDRTGQDRQDRTNTYAQQVARAYAAYPRKLGKTKGLKKLAREIKSDQDLANLEKAISNYATSVKDTEPQFVKHFSTFVSEWRDWVEPITDPKANADWDYIAGKTSGAA